VSPRLLEFCVTAGMMALLLGVFVGLALLGVDDLLAFVLTMIILVVSLRLLAPYTSRWEVEAEERELDKVRKPLLDAIETGPAMERAHKRPNQKDRVEERYRAELVRHLLESLEVLASKEQSLPSGTRVDAVMDYKGADWYITVKVGLNNQQRLTIQGEIEDILLHAPAGNRDLWIVVVVGVDDDPASSVWGQIKHLYSYTINRQIPLQQEGLYSSMPEGRRVYIEVAHVPISNPLVAALADGADGVGDER
jgi:hypothetical protein